MGVGKNFKLEHPLRVMIYNPEKREIILNRELSKLDKFVIDFCKLLDEYVLVSGYVSILFGRSRATEDVDLLVPEMDIEAFRKLWAKMYENGFECVTTDNPKEAFQNFKETHIRFSRIGIKVPNMEVKEIKNDVQKYSLKNKIRVSMGKEKLFVSSIEMQIVYKLNLSKSGNTKDLEDARHLYKIFEEKINKEELLVLGNKLGVKDRLKLLK